MYTLCTFQAALNVECGTIHLKDCISSKPHPAVFIPDAAIRDTLLGISLQFLFSKKKKKNSL